MEKEDLIIDLLKESRKTQQKDSRDIADIKSDIAVMKVDVHANKEDLEEHMLQTKTVKALALDIRQEALKERILLKEHVNYEISLINEKLSVKYLLKLIVSGASALSVILGAAAKLMGFF